MTEINRKDLPARYLEMMETEAHHDHPIIIGSDGRYRWQRDAAIDHLVDHMGLNEIVELLHRLDHDKNSEIFRKLYREMGYSLDGYWEVFYWEMNNEQAGEYVPPSSRFCTGDKCYE